MRERERKRERSWAPHSRFSFKSSCLFQFNSWLFLQTIEASSPDKAIIYLCTNKGTAWNFSFFSWGWGALYTPHICSCQYLLMHHYNSKYRLSIWYFSKILWLNCPSSHHFYNTWLQPVWDTVRFNSWGTNDHCHCVGCWENAVSFIWNSLFLKKKKIHNLLQNCSQSTLMWYITCYCSLWSDGVSTAIL